MCIRDRNTPRVFHVRLTYYSVCWMNEWTNESINCSCWLLLDESSSYVWCARSGRFDVPLLCRCCPGWVVIGGDKKIQRRIQSIIHSRNDTTRYGMLHCFLTVWIYVHSKERKIERKKAQHMNDAPHVIRQTRKRSTSQVGEDHKQQTAIRTVCLVVVVDHHPSLLSSIGFWTRTEYI